jgi:hypothetical protein
MDWTRRRKAMLQRGGVTVTISHPDAVNKRHHRHVPDQCTKIILSFCLLLSFFPPTMNDFSDSEMEALCRLVSIFSGGLPGGSLPLPRNNTDEVFKMWTQKIRTMSTTECQRLTDAGNPERMHEFALRWVVDSPLVRFLLLTGHPQTHEPITFAARVDGRRVCSPNGRTSYWSTVNGVRYGLNEWQTILV